MKNRISVVRSSDYDGERIEAGVRQAVDMLGGMGRFVQPGQKVLVKPNMVQSSDPARAVVTHPMVVRAVVKLAQEVGGSVLMADNPFVIPPTQRSWQNLYERIGLAAVAAETGAQLNTSIIPQQHPHPEGELIKIVDTSSFLTDADVVISVPRLKTHGLMRFTGAVKNLFGTVPGTTKAGYHVKLQTVDRFAEMLLDLVSFCRPTLTVMDAIVGMDGDGPSAGDPYPIGMILASPDPVALDVAAISLVGHEPTSVPTVAGAVRRGWTTGRASDLDLVGDGLDTLQVNGFRMPSGGRSAMDLLPPFLQRMGTRMLVASPRVTHRCIGCGLCVETCPVQTISQLEERARIDLVGCIRCYCCHEGCPEQAIELHHPWPERILAHIGH